MPREPRRVRERSLIRRDREDPRSRLQREVSPPGTSRNRGELRERNHWEKEQTVRHRSRTPRSDRHRGRITPRRSMDRLRYEAPAVNQGRNSRSREREMRLRRSSARPEISRAMYDDKFPIESKFIDDRFSDRPSSHWTDPSQDISSAALGYQNSQQYPTGQVSENPTDIPVIPEFNPESSKLNSNEWLRLLEITATDRGWKQDEKLYIMTSRFAGFARQWYLTSGINCKSWGELRDAFCKAFPTELDYHGLLKKMLSRVKEEDEDLSSYFLHKVALLNTCEIQGVKAVSCIISGLTSSKMQQRARLEKCEDPDQLYLFLRTLNKDAPSVAVSASKKDENSIKGDREVRVEKWKSKKDCYFCGTSGHVVANCRLIKRHTCSVCHQVGHECEPLLLENKRNNPVHNQVMEGSLSHVQVQPKCFTEVFINGTVFKAYLDFESEAMTIKEENAIQSRLPIKKQIRVVRGFAGSSISCIGYIDTNVYIDRAMANVRLSVVPDHIQNIPIIIGQVFTQQAHIVTLKDGGKIRFYQRSDNGETKFDF